jgi:hypothetical protein
MGIQTLSLFMLITMRQYGDVFTFILFGRHMTVAIGPKGSNLILGGKLSEVSAEAAYTVGFNLRVVISSNVLKRVYWIAPDNSCLWSWRRL